MMQDENQNLEDTDSAAPAKVYALKKAAPLDAINREFQEKSVMKAAKELKMSYINLSATPLNVDFLKLVPIEDSKEGKIVSYYLLGMKLKCAVAEPENEKAKAVVKVLEGQGYEVVLSLCSEPALRDAIDRYDESSGKKKIEIVSTVEESSVGTYGEEMDDLANLNDKLKNLPAPEGLNLINLGAMKTGASDLHFEPEEKTVGVRFRIDGVLHRVFDIDTKTYGNIANEIKYESKMQMNVNNVPQDGRYGFEFNGTKVGVRVSSIPTPYGESFVCRLLVGNRSTLSLEDSGFTGLALKKLQHATEISQGMILSTGPTGSGKSTTLFTLLSMMKSPENKVISLEDPVEYNIPGVTQSQINEKRGYDFSSGLRTILRQDPDIVMLGEIRDKETGQTAAQAALTGHVLLSTLHTNSAIETIPRLINMGLPPFMVAPALNTIVAQRLVRRVCPGCATFEAPSECEKKEFENVLSNLQKICPNAMFEMPSKIPKVHECEKCSNTGYKGRMVIAEVITMTSELKDLVMNNASTVDLITAARKEGIMTMREDGFAKVAAGHTTLEEVHRVTNLSV